MLFILAMDPLQRLLDMATQHGVLTTLPVAAARWRTSMYADDAAIFINPLREDLEAITAILHEFGIVSGLHINMQKSSVHPIRCQEHCSHAATWDCNCIRDPYRKSTYNL
jgi:hypothetical protein